MTMQSDAVIFRVIPYDLNGQTHRVDIFANTTHSKTEELFGDGFWVPEFNELRLDIQIITIDDKALDDDLKVRIQWRMCTKEQWKLKSVQAKMGETSDFASDREFERHGQSHVAVSNICAWKAPGLYSSSALAYIAGLILGLFGPRWLRMCTGWRGRVPVS